MWYRSIKQLEPPHPRGVYRSMLYGEKTNGERENVRKFERKLKVKGQNVCKKER
jgi:hypothetical protein